MTGSSSPAPVVTDENKVLMILVNLTRAEGHGFGPHSSAVAAQEQGGALLAHSEGRGHGATFVLELPYNSLQGEP